MKKIVNKKRADISQIQKYLNGELDARAMHQLEREAQDDPFLMDALEGYTSAESNQQGNLTVLQQLLEARTAIKVRKLIPWTAVSVAASVIAFAVIIGLLYKGKDEAPAQKVAINETVKNKAPLDSVPAANYTLAEGMPAIKADKQSIALIKPSRQANEHNGQSKLKEVKETDLADKMFSALPPASAEMIVKDDEANPDSSSMDDAVVGYFAKKKQDSTKVADFIVGTKKQSSFNKLSGKAEGVAIKVRQGNPASSNPAVLGNLGLPSNLVSGVVLNRTDGLPLPGVSVNVVGKTTGTLTDANGKFTLPNVKKDEEVAFGYLGYSSKVLNVKGADSLKVEMEASNSSLSEVVVVTRDKIQLKAHPVIGWKQFEVYLLDNAIATDNKTGVVEIKFTVKPNGDIVNIGIVKGLSAVNNSKAINIIQAGPKWIGNANGKAEQVKLKINFHNQ